MLRRPLFAAALALTLTPPSAALAAKDWTAPVDAGFGEVHHVALAPGGNLAIAYRELHADNRPNLPRITSRTLAGSFTDAATSAAGGALPWTLATTADGRILGHALQDSRPHEAVRPPGVAGFGALAPMTDFGTMTAATVAYSANGTHLLGWRDGGQRFVQVRNPDTSREVPVDFGVAGGFGAPRGAVAGNGDAVAWVSRDSGFSYRVRSGGEWQAAQPVEGTSAQVAMNARGDAVLTWTESAGTLVKAAYRPAGATGFGASVELGTTTQLTAISAPAIGPDGTAVVVFRRVANGSEPLQAVALTAAGLGDVTTLAPASAAASHPRVVVDAGGRGWALWAQPDGSAGDVFVSRAGPGLAFGVATQLDPEDEDVARGTIRLAADGAGDAAVAWTANDQPEPRVRLRHFTDVPDQQRPDDRPGPIRGGGPVGGGTPTPPAPSPAPVPSTPRGTGGTVAQALTKLVVKRSGRKATVTFTLRVAGPVSLVVERRVGRKWRATARKATVRGVAGANRATLSLKGLKPGRHRVVVRAGAARAEKALTLPR
jgi:hypothetical protein